MPTGFTNGVREGTVTDFRAFALLCARAFGATVMMRDEPLDAPIPDEFKPSDYYAKRAAETEAELSRIRDMTNAECEEAAVGAHERSKDYSRKCLAQKATEKARYEAMLAKVDLWLAPSADHAGLKTFMREQLESSIEFDCGDYEPAIVPLMSGADWRAKQLAELQDSHARYRKKQREEEERTATRNKWVRELRESLRGLP